MGSGRAETVHSTFRATTIAQTEAIEWLEWRGLYRRAVVRSEHFLPVVADARWSTIDGRSWPIAVIFRAEIHTRR